ncbi:MAG: hypothetical protein ACRC8A_13125 [Microcoleaceae cyanobacterium]
MGNQQKRSFWDFVTQKASGIRQSVHQNASETGKTVVGKATEVAIHRVVQVGEAIAQGASETKRRVQDKANEVQESIGQAASEVSKSVVETVVETTVSSVESVSQKAQIWVEAIHLDQPPPGSSVAVSDWSLDELYHIFMSPQVTVYGGTQMVTLKTGKSYQVKIPPDRTEGSNLQLRGCGLQRDDAFVVLHTLFNTSLNIDRRVNHLVAQAPIYDRTKVRCLEAYSRIGEALPTDDFAALDLLDYLVNSSKLYAEIGQRYTIASQNSRLVGLETCLESALSASSLNKSEKHLLRATYQYLRAGEAVPNLEVLAQLDTIMLNSSLKPALKQCYWMATATTWVITTDLVLVYCLHQSPTLSESDRPKLLSTYLKWRDNPTAIADVECLKALDSWIAQAGLPRLCQTLYHLVREFNPVANFDVEQEALGETFRRMKSMMQAVVCSTTTPPLEMPPIHTINFAAGSLTEKVYSAVCRGGLGLLGKPEPLQDANHWVSVAMSLVVAQVAEMEPEIKVRLGIPAVSSGMATRAMGANWQAVGSFEVTESGISQLSGIVAYRAMMLELRNTTELAQAYSSTANFNTFNTLSVWRLLTRNQDKQRIIKDLESLMYS